jgi:hypothetical protein
MNLDRVFMLVLVYFNFFELNILDLKIFTLILESLIVIQKSLSFFAHKFLFKFTAPIAGLT